MGNWKIEAVILALGFGILGNRVESGLKDFANRDRVVKVKGLAETEVAANKVTWPLMYKVLGNDLSSIYDQIKKNNKTVEDFLKKKGIKANEISINAPEVLDLQADRYNNTPNPNRYNVTVVITVTSKQVNLVRRLLNEQSELLKQGLAVTSSGDYRYNVQYEYTGLNEIKPKMIEEATKNAREAAEKFAKDSDSDLGGIKQAYQGQFIIEDRDATTPYIKRVRVVNTIDYALED